MQLRVTHETRYAYTPAVQTAQHMAHLRPLQTPSQELLEHCLQVQPAPDQRTDARDIHGNSRTFFSLQSLHDRLVVTARSVVATRDARWPAADVRWERVQALYRYEAGCRWEPSAEFVFASPLVSAPSGVCRLCASELSARRIAAGSGGRSDAPPAP